MARPQKDGLEYFPLNTDIDQDDKLQLIEAQFGITGFGIVIKLLMKIYREGYYYEWSEKEQLLFSRRVNVDINEVNDVINACLKWDLFNTELFKKHGILTSRGIQRRYFEAVSRRKEVEVVRQYCLIDLEKYTNVVCVDINPVNVDNNPPTDAVNADINSQSKVKKSKVNDPPLYSPQGENPQQKPEKQIFEHWNSKGIVVHRSLDDKTKRKIKTAIKTRSPDLVMQAIDNYTKVLGNPNEFYFSYKWTLGDFLQRGLDKFMDWEIAANNYRRGQQNTTSSSPASTAVKNDDKWEGLNIDNWR